MSGLETADGEHVLGRFPARLHEPPQSGLNSFVAFHVTRWIVRRFTRRRAIDAAARQHAGNGFPFAARMVLVVTARQVLVFEASGSGFVPGAPVGAIDREAIHHVWWPRVGGARWRSLALALTSGATASILVRRGDGDRLIEMLGHPDLLRGPGVIPEASAGPDTPSRS